nr:hypothetical protein [Paraburkholderia silvatlantica]
MIVFANVSDSAPQTDDETRIEARDLGAGCWEIVAHHGFVERPNLPHLLAALQGRLGDWRFDPQQTTFYLPRDEVLREHAQQDVSRWRAALRVHVVSLYFERGVLRSGSRARGRARRAGGAMSMTSASAVMPCLPPPKAWR